MNWWTTSRHLRNELQLQRIEIRELRHLLRRYPERRAVRLISAFGQGKVQFMQNFSITPGQTGRLNVIFADANNVQHPLSAVPTAAVSVGTGTVAPNGTQTATDASYGWDVTAPAVANAGDTFTVHVEGTNPDGHVDAEDYVFTVAALDDTKQIATFG